MRVLAIALVSDPTCARPWARPASTPDHTRSIVLDLECLEHLTFPSVTRDDFHIPDGLQALPVAMAWVKGNFCWPASG